MWEKKKSQFNCNCPWWTPSLPLPGTSECIFVAGNQQFMSFTDRTSTLVVTVTQVTPKLCATCICLVISSEVQEYILGVILHLTVYLVFHHKKLKQVGTLYRPMGLVNSQTVMSALHSSSETHCYYYGCKGCMFQANF